MTFMAPSTDAAARVAVDDGDDDPSVAHHGRVPPAGGEPAPPPWRAPWVVGIVALALRWWMPGETLLTQDEFNWTIRSLSFGKAIRSWNLAGAVAAAPSQKATRPGVTTMWTGFLAEELVSPVHRLWTWLGIGPGPSGLRLGHMLMALWCSLGLVAFVVIARRLVGPRASLVAGGILAVEPMLVGHSAVLHTDALVTVYAGLAVVALVAAFEQARVEDQTTARAAWWRVPSIALASIAGAAAAIAVLTKLNAVVLIGAAVPVAFAGQRFRRSDTVDRQRRSGVALAVFVAVTVTLFVALWPALWVDPIAQLQATIGAGHLAGESTTTFFLGQVITHVDRRFYFVAAWYRASPWLLIASFTTVVSTILQILRRARSPTLPRRVILSLTAPPAVYLAVLVLSAKQYDRYLLPLLPFAAVGIGVVVARLTAPFEPTGWVHRSAWAAFAILAVWTASLAPFAISYTDPLVGGQRVASGKIDLGWGEGVETVLARTHPGGRRCPTISSRVWLLGQSGCWKPVSGDWLHGTDAPPDLVLIYIDDRQRAKTGEMDAYLRAHGTMVDALIIDGVAYVELWRPTRQPA